MSSIEIKSKTTKGIVLLIVVILVTFITILMVEGISYLILLNQSRSELIESQNSKYIGYDSLPYKGADDYNEIKSFFNGLSSCPKNRIIFDEKIGFPKLVIENVNCNNIENIENGLRVTMFQPKSYQKRILIFGGSTIWGTGSTDRNTIPSLIQKKFSEARKEVKVINYGFSSVVAHQQLQRLRSVELTKDDIVIFYDGGNDIWNSMVYGTPMGTIIGYNDKNKFEQIKNRVKFFFSNNSYFYKLLVNIKSKNLYKDLKSNCLGLSNDEISKRAEKGFQEYSNSIIQAKNYTDSNGAVFIHFLQPSLVSAKPFSKYSLYLINKMSKELSCGLNLVDIGYNFYESKYHSFSNKFNTNDLTDSLYSNNEEIEYFIDWIHVSSNGNKKIAEIVYNTIKDY